ncbi:MAG: phage tail assembly protein [Tagaea sp.]|nr:phage tail assembly protein [Tagaea sp.]
MAAETPKHFVHKLTTQVEANGKTIDTLTVRTDIRAKDFNAGDAAEGANAKMMRIVAHLANVPPSTIADLPAQDYVAIMVKLAPFIGDGPGMLGILSAT